ncbi:kinase-like protein [Massarina eburnea CBS 473.64]|uniref:Kinase-like protein n=1 Tax=Massarina eburnea CBS 473.64 TaxID=1395130 RepID=A0A6A6RFE3_9PLEO|nr:kinase-like protein [Massarina eburnea CBS 473.64]
MGEDKLLSPASSHRYIRHGSAHFEELEKIGKGGSAEVARVRHRLSGKQFACKRIRRADNVKAQRNQLIEFEQEVGVLKRINHGHTVSLVASFTDLASFSLILNPVAKDVLKSVLARQSREQPLPASDIATLRRSFGCLATALAYLHEQKVRHKDIKPGNILLSEGRVYFCDFGIARDWSESEHSTTEGDPLKFTRRYCAPEVIGRDQRNSKSDIWSLGCVYLEILSVVKGYSLEEVNNFFLEQSGGLSERGLWSAPEVMSAWLVKLRSEKYDSADDIPLNWITPMVRTEHEDRLSASELVNIIHKDSADLPRPALFVAPCCARVDSIAPADPVDSPSLHEPVFGGLGIRAARMSPPKNMLDLPPRNSNSSIDQRSYASPNRHRASRERSVSPRTQGSDPRDSLDSNLIPLDHISSHREALRHIASVSDSQTSSSLFSASIPESDAASSPRAQRSPVPPPASFEVKCCCAPYPRERHIFNASYSATTPFELDSKIQTVETRPKCEIGENRVQVYETQPQDPSVCTSPPPMLWWVTRRLVVSYLSGTPEMRHCSSFWIPLADIRFALSGATVTLRYSDCNQMTERSSGNYGQHYDWLYDHEHPNNELNITFNDVAEAEQFIDTIRFPYEDGALVTHGRNVKLSNFSEINIFDVGRPGVRNYRAATITTASSTIATSKLFIQWPELDLVMQKNVTNDPNAPFHMAVEVRNLTTPTYHSNVRGEPAADYNKVAWFKRAMQLKATMAIDLPVKDDVAQQFPKPPSGNVFRPL